LCGKKKKGYAGFAYWWGCDLSPLFGFDHFNFVVDKGIAIHSCVDWWIR